MVLYMTLYVAFKIVGDPLLRIVKVRNKKKQKNTPNRTGDGLDEFSGVVQRNDNTWNPS